MTHSQRIWIIIALAWVTIELLLAFCVPYNEYVLPIMGLGTIVIMFQLLLKVRDRS